MAVRLTVPVTVVTGFLGSGKTTLINRLLHEPHGERIAVIENEFGETGVDAEFLTRSDDETIVQLTNGCLCCTVRGDLALALQQIAAQAQARNIAFDRVLIETTGLADPGPVIQTFLAETSIEAFFHLDGVVALADALHAGGQAEHAEFQAQLGYADRIIVSKADAASASQREALEAVLTRLNSRAPVISCNLREAPIAHLFEHLFDIRGFANDYVPVDETRRVLANVGNSLQHLSTDIAHHTANVRSCVFTSETPLDLARLNNALDALIAHYGNHLWRCKGIVNANGHRSRLVLQGVRGLIQINGGTMWRPFEARRTTLVFIGHQIESETISAALRACEQQAYRGGIKSEVHQ